MDKIRNHKQDSHRGRNKEYVVIPKNTEERLLIEVFGEMDFEERTQLLAYAKKIMEH